MTRSRLPLSSPFFQSLPRERLQKWPSCVCNVRDKASAFIQANISTSPEAASVTMAGMRPSASKRGWNSVPVSISSGVPRGAKSSDGLGAMIVIPALSWPGLSRPSIHPLAPAFVESWILGTSPRMTPGSACRLQTMISEARAVHHLQETVAIAGARLQLAREARGDGLDAGLPHPARRHALMLGLDQHGNAARPQRAFDGIGDLGGHGLLRLQALGEDLDHARNLGDADDAAAGQVGHVSHAEERGDVVLAVAFDADVAQHHEIVIAARFL